MTVRLLCELHAQMPAINCVQRDMNYGPVLFLTEVSTAYLRVTGDAMKLRTYALPFVV
jgi:hypothetical protein